MQTNVHFSIYRPFPHPSCLVEHLEFVNHKLHAAETHLRVQHTINHSYSPHKMILHKSLDNKHHPIPYHPTILNPTNTGIETRRHNALPTKNKINLISNSQSLVIKNEELEDIQNTLQLSKQRGDEKQYRERKESRQRRTKQIDQEIERQISIKRKEQGIKQKQGGKQNLKQQRQRERERQNRRCKHIQDQRTKCVERQNKQKVEYQREIKKLNDLIVRIKKEHTLETESLQQQLQKYQNQVNHLHQSKIRTDDSKLKNEELNNLLSEQLEELRSLYRKEKEKSNLQRKQIHQFKKKLFELESSSIDNNHQVEELQEIISHSNEIHQELEAKNNELEGRNIELEEYIKSQLAQLEEIRSETENYKNQLKPLHGSCINACEVLLSVSNVLDKLKMGEMPNGLVSIKCEIGSMKEEINNVLDQLQSMYHDRVGDRLRVGRRPVGKETEKSINDSIKYLRTCADEDTLQSNDPCLYQMILCQAMVLEENL